MKVWLVWEDYFEGDTLLVAAASEKAAKQWLLNAGYEHKPGENWYPWMKRVGKMDGGYTSSAIIISEDIFEGFTNQELADMPHDHPIKVASRNSRDAECDGEF